MKDLLGLGLYYRRAPRLLAGTAVGESIAVGQFTRNRTAFAGTAAGMATQTGTGNFTKWSPLSISGLLFWSNTESANIVLTSGKVSQWTDLSGLGNHAVQATAGSRPTITSASLNGRDVMTFVATNLTFLRIPPNSAFQPATAGIAIFAVWRWTGATHGTGFQAICTHQSTAAFNDGYGMNNGPNGTDGQVEGWILNYNSSQVGTTYSNTSWRNSAFTNDHVHNTFYTGGVQVQQTNKANTITYSTSADTCIGAYNATGGGTTHAGYADLELAMLVMASPAFSATDIANLNRTSVALYGV